MKDQLDVTYYFTATKKRCSGKSCLTQESNVFSFIFCTFCRSDFNKNVI